VIRKAYFNDVSAAPRWRNGLDQINPGRLERAALSERGQSAMPAYASKNYRRWRELAPAAKLE
jgi:hypothetical protein